MIMNFSIIYPPLVLQLWTKSSVYNLDNRSLPPPASVSDASVDIRNSLPLSLSQIYYHPGSSLIIITFNYKNKKEIREHAECFLCTKQYRRQKDGE